MSTSSDYVEALAAYAQTAMNLKRARAGQSLCTLEALPRHAQDQVLYDATTEIRRLNGLGFGEAITLVHIARAEWSLGEGR